jgi:hypothetical protein
MTEKQQAIIDKLVAQKKQYGHGRLNHWILDDGDWIDVRDCFYLAELGLLKKEWRGYGTQMDVYFELAA